jgi:hypothetical protein
MLLGLDRTQKVAFAGKKLASTAEGQTEVPHRSAPEVSSRFRDGSVKGKTRPAYPAA